MPALAVARCFGERASSPAPEIAWIGLAGSADEALIREAGIPFHGIRAGKIRRYFSLKNLTDVFRTIGGFAKAWSLLGKLKPDVVFSKGGFVAVPVCLAARLRRIPVVTHESDASPGLATRLIAPYATKVLLGFPFGTPPGWRTEVVGNPVRAQLFKGDAARIRARYGVPDGIPLVLVLGGSSGSARLNQLIEETRDRILPHANVVHQTGAGNVVENPGLPGYSPLTFLDTETMADALAAADIVVSRSGAGTLSELAALGKTAILVPLPTHGSRGDQLHNAERLREAGAAVVVPEESLTNESFLAELLRLLGAPAERAAYGAKLATFARPDAARRIAAILLEAAAH